MENLEKALLRQDVSSYNKLNPLMALSLGLEPT